MKWMHMHTHTHTVTTAKHSCEVRRNVHNLTHLCGALIKPLIKMYIEPKWGITHTWTRTNTHLHRKRQRHSHTVKVVRGLTRKVHILVIFRVVWKTTSYLSVVSSGDAIKWKQCTPETQSEGDEEERCHSQHPTQRESDGTDGDAAITTSSLTLCRTAQTFQRHILRRHWSEAQRRR